MTGAHRAGDGGGRQGDVAATEAAVRPAVEPTRRSTLKAVSVPVEHGGWGLTAEPVLLGLLVAPSVAGLCVGVAAIVAFLARTPLKVLLVDRHRGRTLERTAVARRVFAVEATLLVVLGAVALVRSTPGSWWPIVAIAPLVGTELWFDMRSRSRRLVPELAGAVGIGGVTALIMTTGGEATDLAAAAWMILAARAITAIVTVRDQVGRLHGRSGDPRLVAVADLVATATVLVAALWVHRLLAGAIAVIVAIAIQRVLARRPPPRAVILGIRQSVLGLVVVLATAIGITLG